MMTTMAALLGACPGIGLARLELRRPLGISIVGGCWSASADALYDAGESISISTAPAVAMRRRGRGRCRGVTPRHAPQPANEASGQAPGDAGWLPRPLGLTACTSGRLRPPDAPVPAAYKEAWSPPAEKAARARPAEAIDRGAWWSIYHDPALDGWSGRSTFEPEFEGREAPSAKPRRRRARAAHSSDRDDRRSATRSRSSGTAEAELLGRIRTSSGRCVGELGPRLWGSVRRTSKAMSRRAGERRDLANAGCRRRRRSPPPISKYAPPTTGGCSAAEVKALPRRCRSSEQHRAARRTSRRSTGAGAARRDQGVADRVGRGRAQLEHSIAVLIGKPRGADHSPSDASSRCR